MRRHVAPMFLSSAIVFMVVGLSYVYYSKHLDAAQFGLYSIALAVGAVATLVLDGGIKTTLIKRETGLSTSEKGTLLWTMIVVAALLSIGLYISKALLLAIYPALGAGIEFVMGFSFLYLGTYPFIVLPTATLERGLRYKDVAWIEMVGQIIERGGPAALLSVGWGMPSFLVALAAGRLARIGLLARYAEPVSWKAELASLRNVGHLVGEGTWLQIGALASAVRDNLHVILVGPLFGPLWVGYYGWAMQLCQLSSQIFVQIAARISVPLAAQAPDLPSRWAQSADQIKWLSAVTSPVLVSMVILAPGFDHQWFSDKWEQALVLLPFLAARMVPGLASTPLGTLLLVQEGSRAYAMTLWMWTSVEIVFAVIALYYVGPTGLAASYAISPWLAVYMMLYKLRLTSIGYVNHVFHLTVANKVSVFLIVFVLSVLVGERDLRIQHLFRMLYFAMPAALVIIVVSYASDKNIRNFVLSSLNNITLSFRR